ncbi:non-specific lipid-transfer protein 1-like [Zingiber officinale]|uniref:non-specific lipid-transfer protein 1-like n=1 Tax=Zingiber officinale TaxID=94328 RepID=UPI001C4A90F2|nr:non-specific lipid-transfer protein 1-like [Zingiber officinale]
MARSTSAVAAAALLLLVALAAVPRREAALTCGNVVMFLSPCIPYARGTTAEPSEACCSGVRGLNEAAKTTPDRQTACNCIKSTIFSLPGIKPAVVSGVPSKCGVSVPYPISTSIDCSKVE